MLSLPLLAFLCDTARAVPAASFEVALWAETSHFPHVWEESVGSGHFTLALRADWQKQITRVRKELGMKRVRMHGMLNDDMSVSLGPARPDDHPAFAGGFSFVNLNAVIDFLDEIDMDVLFEVGFMPSWLAANASQTHHFYKSIVSPPRNYTEWGDVIETVAQHLHDHYGDEAIKNWLFEVWNEPNGNFWTGNQADYFQLYKQTANAFHRVSPSFRVGGPSTSGHGKWVPEFLKFCNDSGVGQPDFVSTHQYAGKNNEGHTKTAYDSAYLAESLKNASMLVGELPLYITEWGGTAAHGVPQLDDSAYAPFIVSTLAQVQNFTSMMSIWTFSDIFEESGMPSGSVTFSGGFGLMNVYGVPKPPYRAMQLLHMAGDERVPVSKMDNGCGTASTLALTNSTHLAIFVTNEAPLPLDGPDPVKVCDVAVRVSGGVQSRGTMVRIDEGHSNPKKAWEAMGSPAYPSPKQLAALEAASDLQFESFTFEDGRIEVSLPRGLVVFFLRLDGELPSVV